MDPIEHVVLLMLENRSFDSLLGWLYENDSPALNIPPAPPGDRFRGLHGVDLSRFVNTAMNGGLSTPPVRGTSGFTVPSIAPGEEFEHVNVQFFETEDPAPGTPATMQGVLQDFVAMMKHGKYGDDAIVRRAKMIMETYTPGQLPVLNQLARHYAVCDAWFASVPSQTNPNRAFTLCGTSHGLVNNGELETNPLAKQIEKLAGMGIGDDRFDDDTIFNALAAAGVDWTVFWQTSYLPQKLSTLLRDAPALGALTAVLPPPLAAVLMGLLAMLGPYSRYMQELSSGELSSCYTWRLFPHLQKIPNADQHFKRLDEFHRLARAGKLPRFSYIEPFWTIAQSSVDDSVKKLMTAMGNDYHPPCNMIVSENFVKEVYASLIANRDAWNKTLLIITFDEFVGSFDHVPPPAATPPWGKHGKPGFPIPSEFGFDRFGGRVPAILVSPWVQKGTVFRSTGNVPYDHTSIIATVLKWLHQDSRKPAFGERVEVAPTFDNVLTLDQPRTDERAIGFMDTARSAGELVRYGDPIVLRNQDGKYISAFSKTLKAIGNPLPADLLGFAVDLDAAAYFPTLGGAKRAALTLRSHLPDPPDQVGDGDRVQIVTLEAGVGANNFLGAWADSHDCYYYNNYLDGLNADKQDWYVQQVERHGQPLRYGDKICLVSRAYKDQRLTHDARPLEGSWITTAQGGDYWIVEPLTLKLPSPPGGKPVKSEDPLMLFAQDGKTLSVMEESYNAALATTQYYPRLNENPSESVICRLLKTAGKAQISDGDMVQLQTMEARVGEYDRLGAWATPSLYYYKPGYDENEGWVIRKVDTTSDPIIRTGDATYLINAKYKDQWIVPKDTAYLTTVTDGEYFFVLGAAIPLGPEVQYSQKLRLMSGERLYLTAMVKAYDAAAVATEYFPKVARSGPIGLTLEGSSGAVQSGATVLIQTTEAGVGDYKQLGAWASKNLYYYKPGYDKQKWTIVRVHSGLTGPLRYGEAVYLKNISYNQYMTLDGEYLTTKAVRCPWFLEKSP